MSEESTTEAKPTAKAEEKPALVMYEANAGYPHEVYPEIKEFFESRRQAQWELNKDFATARLARAVYVSEKSSAFYADEANVGSEFNEYEAGRTWDREHGGHPDRFAERRYHDFMDSTRTVPTNRSNPENPNSWAILYETTTHAEVKWVIDNCLNNSSEALVLLGYLPATAEQLWEFAKVRHDMCEVFDRYMTQAEAAGIFSGDPSSVGQREFRALQSWVRRELYTGQRSEVARRVSAIMRVMREAHVKELAEAKAEWQGLDEAWRSERARRAAATRAANRQRVAVNGNHPDVTMENDAVVTEKQIQGAVRAASLEIKDIVSESPINLEASGAAFA